MIQEIQLNGLDNKPIKTTKKPPPRSINENLPPCYFTSIFMLGIFYFPWKRLHFPYTCPIFHKPAAYRRSTCDDWHWHIIIMRLSTDNQPSQHHHHPTFQSVTTGGALTQVPEAQGGMLTRYLWRALILIHVEQKYVRQLFRFSIPLSFRLRFDIQYGTTCDAWIAASGAWH